MTSQTPEGSADEATFPTTHPSRPARARSTPQPRAEPEPATSTTKAAGRPRAGRAPPCPQFTLPRTGRDPRVKDRRSRPPAGGAQRP